MEVFLFCSCIAALLPVLEVHTATIAKPLELLTLDDLSRSDREYLEYLQEESIRNRRSDDIFSLIKSKISQGIKSKFGEIASASSHLSSSKSYQHYEPPIHEGKDFSFWELHKAVLRTLFQAVKAIKGGLMAVKGQLIKGGGYIISAKGRLISAKGEAISNMGKNIASSAHLIPADHSAPSGPAHYGGPPTGGGDFSAHGVEFFPAHGGGHTGGGYSSQKYPIHEKLKDQHPRAAHQGILIFKKVPKGLKDNHVGVIDSHSKPEPHVLDHKPEEPSVPPFTFLPNVMSMFSASSAKDHKPGKVFPAPHPYAHYAEEEFQSKPPDHHNQHETSPSQQHNQPQDQLHHPFYDSIPAQYIQSVTHSNPPQIYQGPVNFFPSKDQLKPPSTSYGKPITMPEEFLNIFKDYQTNRNLPQQTPNDQPLGPLLPYPPNDPPKFEHYHHQPSPNQNPEPQPPPPVTSIDSERLSEILQGLGNYASYPIELPDNSGKQLNLGNKPSSNKLPKNPCPVNNNGRLSDCKENPMASSALSSRSFASHNKLRTIPATILFDPNTLKNYLITHNTNQKRQTSYTTSISRPRRAQNYKLFSRALQLEPNKSTQDTD